jgi:16S rRNA processing protein RimM
MVVVGRIAKPHGLRGHVFVHPETDFVEERFTAGATLWTRRDGREQALTIASARIQNGRPVIAFEGFATIDAVEALHGAELRIPESDLQPLDAGTYYEHQLVGCAVQTATGESIGSVTRVEGGAGSSRLVVAGGRGEILIPLAVDICVAIDVAAKTIRINPPEGLLDLNEVRHRDDLPAHDRRRPGRRGRQPGH